ncbi:acyl-CoA dehydrogenase family protein [Natronolimnohabitans innermongolicus]|uniref:acyl-CoA dehydrogenase family protein n=1 Tax=Natronolimnohabitans innermongolicus TaxID=253107 RepID=UPI000677D147|nr:acyl-CoA dehydrogenase family protein [Natronolimnohabitans innermongolicus]
MAGEKTTCFALSEPDAGSDPQFMETTAETDGDEWVIDGRKSWISNAPYADFAMVFARTSGEPGRIGGISCFLVETDAPGVGRRHPPADGSRLGRPGRTGVRWVSSRRGGASGRRRHGILSGDGVDGNARLGVAAGYSRREPIETRYRTTREKRLTEGSDEMQKQTIVRELRE